MAERMVVEQVEIDKIHVDDVFNCRGEVADADVTELAESIRDNGLLQPIVVAPAGKDKYKLVAGFRRLTAHRLLGRERIDAVINNKIQSDVDASVFNFIENIQRKQLDIIQETRACLALQCLGLNRDEIASKIGMSSGWVQLRLQVAALPKIVQIEIRLKNIKHKDIRDLYTHMIRSGEEACLEAARTLKDAKQKGKQVSVRPKTAKDHLAKRMHSKGEVMMKMETIREAIGNGFHTRCLAWCVGEISELEFDRDIRDARRDKDAIL